MARPITAGARGMEKILIERTCGASGKHLNAGTVCDVVEKPEKDDQIAMADAKLLVISRKAIWVEPEQIEQIPEVPKDRTRPDVAITAQAAPKTKKRGRPKKKKKAAE